MLELLETKKKAVNYYPFGKSFRSFTSSNGKHVYKYSGKEQDDYTDYSSYGFRYYNADLARWMNPDPAHQFNSPYVFNGNVPHLGSDKDGQWFWLAAAIAEWAGAAATTVAAIESAATVYAIASASYNLNKAVANGADFWEALGYTALSAGINYGVGQLAEGLNLSGDWVTQSLQGAGTALASSMITQLVFTGDVRLNDTYGEVLVGAAAGFVASENFHNWAAGDGFKTTRQILDERSNYEEVKLLKPDEMPLEPIDAPKNPKFEAVEMDMKDVAMEQDVPILGGYVTNVYGERYRPKNASNPHVGLDLNTKLSNKKIYSMSEGTVDIRKWNGKNRSGNRIYVNTKIGNAKIRVGYLHMSNTDFAKDLSNGQKIERGTVLGLIGKTGTKVAHLHMQVYINGHLYDPVKFFPNLIRIPNKVGYYGFTRD